MTTYSILLARHEASQGDMRQQYDSDHFPETSRSSEEQMIAFGRALGSVRDHYKTTVRQPPCKKLFISLSPYAHQCH